MASVTATINVQINAANAAAQLTALQSKVAAMNKGMLAATAGGVMAQEKAIRRMGTVLSGSGMFTTGIRNVHTELGRMHQEFDRGSTSLQNYRKNSRMWGKDHSDVNRMAADRVRMLQSQYVALGKEMNGVQQAMQIKPDRMMREFGADAEYAHQKSVLFRRNLQMGSTALVNWGKNTQWAGRQMMVGMGIPIAIAAAGAIKSFNDIEKSSISFKRVYGDATTSVAEKSQMLAKVQKTVGNEMMKYGIAMSDTLDVSAKAAATGARGADLIAATRETMRLATLGNMDYNKALEATIAMQTAFNINSKDMAKTTDFLNAVENQTILSMEDMALAVPRVAPVIKGLGGNVEELAIMMTALRQGGVSAEQGANALKSGLGSLLNPTGTAIEQFDQMGVNLKKIVETNKGDLIGTIQGLGKALDSLSKYDRQRALESLFGKYQYARMGALLKNINSKAVKETMRLAKAGNAELAKMSEQELGQISDSPMIKLRASIEELKAAAAPLGALFSDIAAKIVSFATPVVSFFANNDAAKWGLVVGAGLAALAGTLTMIIGVFANFAGSMVKAGMAVRTFFRFITGQRSLAYVTTDGLEASAAANSLATAAERAAGGMMAEAKAAQLLTSQLEALIAAQNGAAATSRAAGTGIVPTTPVRPGGIPTPAQPTTSQLSTAVLSDRYGPPVRAHLEQQVPLNQAQTAALLSEYRGTGTKIEKSLLAATAPGAAGVMGYIPQSLGWGSKTNNRLSLDDSAMVPRQELLDQLRGRPEQVIAPFLDDVARNAGLTREQVYSDPRVQQWARNATDQMIQRIETSPLEGWKDTDAASHSRGILGTVAGIGPEYAGAWGRMQTPELLNADGNKFNVTQKLSERFPNLFSAWRKKSNARKGVLTGTEQVVADADRYLKLPPSSETPPVIPVDSSGRPQAVILPEGSKAGSQVARTAEQILKQTPAARITPNNQGALPSSPIGARPVTPTPVDPDEANKRSRFGTRGMGLMGAGMLAQTAMMGLQMAGKEVPAAAEYATTGLMGIGMAAMSFPKVSDKVAESMAGLLNPYTIAIGAAIAAIGGTALVWRQINEQSSNDGAALSVAMNDATVGAEEVANSFGNTSYVTQKALDEADATKESLTTSQQFLQSEVGKQFMSDYARIGAETSSTIAASSMGAKIASWVVQGVLTGKDVRGLIVAMNEQSPGSGNMMAAQAGQFLGPKYNVKDPAAAARAIFDAQSRTTSDALSLLNTKSEALTGPSAGNWLAAAGKQIFLPTALKGTFNAVRGLLDGDGVKESVSNIPMIGQFIKAGEDRAASNKLNVATANVWSSQLKTAFANRLAVEAQLTQMQKERKQLQARSDKGVATADEMKRLTYLKKNLPKFKESQKRFNEELAAGFKQTMDAMPGQENQDAQEAWYKAQRRVGRQAGKKDPLLGMGIEQIDQQLKDKMISQGTANDAMAALNTGIMSPTAFQTISENGRALASVGEVIRALPADKVAQIDDVFKGMSSEQRANSVTKYGKAFKSMASQLKLTPQQKADLADAFGIAKPGKPGPTRGAGANRMPKELTQKIKERYIKDKKADVKPKDQEVKIKAKAETDMAKKKVDDLGKAADNAGKKKINIKATVTGAAKKDIKGLGAAAGTGVEIQQTVDRVIGVDETKTPASPLIQLVNRIIAMDMSLIPAAPLVQQILRILTFRPELIPPPPVEQIVRRRVVGGSATGGLFAYANGGVHSGDGKVIGPGGPTDDKVNARLSDGEFVIRASSVQKYGTAFLDAVNRGMYDKNGFAKGTPGTPLKADGLDKDQKKDFEGMLGEAKGIIKEVGAFSKILKHGRVLLGGQMKKMDEEFARYIVDNYNPKEIREMFSGKKDKGAKTIAKKFAAEQRYAARTQLRQSILERKAAESSSKVVGFGAKASVQRNLSADDKLMKFSSPKKFKSMMRQRELAERANQKAAFNSQITGSDSAIFKNQGQGNAALAQSVEALGISWTDVADKIANEGPGAIQEIINLGNAAKESTEALDVAKMSWRDAQSEIASNASNAAQIIRDGAEARARGKFKDNQKIGMSQTAADALIAENEARNSIDQAKIDDVNEKYEKQLEIFDQISQQQQAIANLERGRLSVANALSQGDIAAAAMAAQQQRSDTASFMQEQMRTQLENQQKAQTLALQEAINERMKQSRDLQNEMNLALAIAVREQVGDIERWQNQADAITGNTQLITDQIAEIERRNALLGTVPNPNAPQVPPTTPITVQAPAPVPSGGGKGFARKKKKGKGKAFGGWVPGIGNSDNVPLLATPGEFVMRKAAAARFGPTLQAMNSGSIKDIGGSGGGVNIDNIIFNINGANLNERDIADIAVRKMKSLDSATIRGGRF